MSDVCAGYQPPVELLRNALSSGGVYDHQHQVFQKMQEASFIAATTLPTAPGRKCVRPVLLAQVGRKDFLIQCTY